MKPDRRRISGTRKLAGVTAFRKFIEENLKTSHL
jgi:hypothetical protein